MSIFHKLIYKFKKSIIKMPKGFLKIKQPDNIISDVLWNFCIPGYDNMSNRLNLYGTFSPNPPTQANYEKIPGEPRLGGTEHVPSQYSSRVLRQWKTRLRNSYKQKRHRNMAIKCKRTLRGKNGLKKIW